MLVEIILGEDALQLLQRTIKRIRRRELLELKRSLRYMRLRDMVAS